MSNCPICAKITPSEPVNPKHLEKMSEEIYEAIKPLLLGHDEGVAVAAIGQVLMLVVQHQDDPRELAKEVIENFREFCACCSAF